jgi:hypothetical protein
MLLKKFDDIHFRHFFEGKRPWHFEGFKKVRHASLTWRENDIRLNLNLPRAELEKYRSIERVGTGQSSSRILLLSSTTWEDALSRAASKYSNKESARVEVKPSMVIIQPFDSRKIEPKITSIIGHLPGIGSWFGDNFLEFDKNNLEFKNKKSLYHQISFKDFDVYLTSGLEINDFDSKKFTAYQESYVKIEFKSEVGIYAARGIFDYVESFFNFNFSSPHFTYIFEGWSENKGKSIRKEIVFPYRYKDQVREESDYGNSLLFNYSDIEDVNKLFKQWVSHYEKIQEIAESIILLKSTGVTEELRFTILINALESVHRRYFNRLLEPEVNFNAKVARILSKISDSQEKALVTNRLMYANELTLRKRLSEVAALVVTFGMNTLNNDLVDKIITTRNYLIHGDERLKKSILEYEAMYEVNRYLGKALKLMLLHVFGVKESEIKNIFSTSTQFKDYYRDGPRASP